MASINCKYCKSMFSSPHSASKYCSMSCRFWTYVDRSAGDMECWPWVGGMNKATGYGGFTIEGRQHTAHRIAYILTIGNPGDFVVCHKCDNRPCCNPNHLFKGTRNDNMQDMIQKGRDDHTRSPRGIENGMSKINEDIVRLIRNRGNFETHRAIADELNLTRSQVSRIINRTAWAHVN